MLKFQSVRQQHPFVQVKLQSPIRQRNNKLADKVFPWSITHASWYADIGNITERADSDVLAKPVGNSAARSMGGGVLGAVAVTPFLLFICQVFFDKIMDGSRKSCINSAFLAIYSSCKHVADLPETQSCNDPGVVSDVRSLQGF